MALVLMTVGLVNLANFLMLRNNHIKVLVDWFISVILKECMLKVLIKEEQKNVHSRLTMDSTVKILWKK